MPLVLYLKSHHLTQGHLGFHLDVIFYEFYSLMFTFRSVIHFELIFVKFVRSVSTFIFCVCDCPVVPEPFVEKPKIAFKAIRTFIP